MKVIRVIVFVLVSVGFLSVTVLAQQPKQMSIQVKVGQLRAQPNFLGKIVGSLPYGTRVTILQEQGDWLTVESEDKTLKGWLHKSALNPKKIAFKAGPAGLNQVSSDEVVIAGKGFNQQVEQEFKLGHADIDFRWVDKMEKEFGVPPEELQKFLQAGGITPEGGSL
jgi:hypothetical protein